MALRVEPTDAADTFLVSGRGELHLAILIETMRREGYEFQVSAPEVIMQRRPGHRRDLEPMEEVHIEVPSDYTGVVVGNAGPAQGPDDQYAPGPERHRLLHLPGAHARLARLPPGVPDRHARHRHRPHPVPGYGPYVGPIRQRNHGSLVAWEAGTATPYAMFNAQERGRLFILPGIEIYEGMIVGADPA